MVACEYTVYNFSRLIVFVTNLDKLVGWPTYMLRSIRCFRKLIMSLHIKIKLDTRKTDQELKILGFKPNVLIIRPLRLRCNPTMQ